MTNPFDALARARQLATGSPLVVDAPELSPQCESEAELDQLITGYYKFLHEEISEDAAFLAQIQRMSEVESARRLLYSLRTAAQHSDNEKAARVAKDWRARHGSPQAAAESLAAAMTRALGELGSVALRVARDGADASRWRDVLAVDTGTVFAAVVSDLGLQFTPGNQQRMVRLVDKRLQVQPRNGDRRNLVADYCVQEVLSDRRPLPVPYYQVLDSLGLLGKPGASGAVLVAHSVAEIAPALRGDSFIARVKETWRAAASS
ncbi:hypothetical protein ACFJIY_09850 [Pimelobacter simplex]|uniref:hypothetical protein n=1 Tax=Nocardioides simplex TaxID=2045 RepID=UPI00366D845A